MTYIKVKNIVADNNIIRVHYDVGSALEKYFTSVRTFEVEYSENISTVPASVLVIPFVCNVLPIVWLTDAVIELPELDKEFYEGLPEVIEGYKNLSPMLNFNGSIQVKKFVSNSYKTSDKVAALFSGGADAFATLIAHIKEKPNLVTIWGADVKLSDTQGWTRVQEHTLNTCCEFDLPAPLFIRSNFRLLVIERELDKLVSASGDGWWHGYQHAIAMLGHVAPIAYLQKWKIIYIASSNTADAKIICASDPSIDNKHHIVSSRVWHDQYEYNRQQKIQHIVEYCHDTGRKIQLRVCWITSGGTNCCKCEKCRRTIFALLAENEDPSEYGFKQWREGIQGAKENTIEHCRQSIWGPLVYKQIQSRFNETQAYKYDSDINWICKINFMHLPPKRDYAIRIYRRLRQFLGKIKRKIFS